MTVGETAYLYATLSSYNADNQSITWTSSNEKIASVDYGTVTAHAVGSATITVTTDDGGKKADCTVTVNPVSVDYV